MKIAFFWTPQFAADILSGILMFPEMDVKVVVSQPDMPVGRKQEILVTPTKFVAQKNNLGVKQPEKLKKNKEFEGFLKSLNLDFIVVVAYGKIIPKSILDIPKYGCINIHGSLLPKYRGASPVQACLKNGDRETWLTTMYMSEGMDEWDILKIAKIDIDILDTSETLFQKFVEIWPGLLWETLQEIQGWFLVWTPQNHQNATYCSKISKEDGEISFQRQTVQEIHNLFRAYTPWPGIHTFYEGKKLALEACGLSFTWENSSSEPMPVGSFLKLSKNRYGIICADTKIIEVIQVKLEGKKSMDVQSFVNGNKNILNYIFA